MNLKEIAYAHHLPAKRKRQAACKRYKSVAWNHLTDHQVAKIDAYDFSESRDSQESAFFGERETRLQGLQRYGITD